MSGVSVASGLLENKKKEMESKDTGENEPKEDDIPKPAIILKLKRSRFLQLFPCSVCPSAYVQMINLKYHVRREHFNLIAKVTKRQNREIDEVWLERVANSDAVIEIKKSGYNKYVMKKSSNPEGIEIVEATDTIDMTPLYPDCTRTRIKKIMCHVCKKKYFLPKYRKHLEEDHDD